MKENSTRQSAAERARMRRLRAKYRGRIAIAATICFIIGLVAGIFGYRMLSSRRPELVSSPEPTMAVEPEVTPEPEPEPEPEAEPEDDGWDFADLTDDGEGKEAATDVEAPPEAEAPEDEPEAGQVEAPAEAPAEEPTAAPTAEPTAAPTEAPTAEPTAAPTEAPTAEPTAAPTAEPTAAPTEAPTAEPAAEPTPVPDLSSDQVAEYDPAEEDAGDFMDWTEPDAAVEAPEEGAEAPAEDAEAAAAAEAAVEPEVPAEPEAPAGPQVIAIVPYGESFTYTTQIKADGTARVEATDEPYEAVSFTQTMKGYMRPADFANKYSTKYKLQGNEAGAGFELVLNDYTGAATIVPQNVVDITLRSESGNSIERGYQLMDAEIAGNYNVALNTNVPQVLYKRYQYSNAGEEMFYLVVTTYNDGVAQQILFQLESDEPEPEPEIVYNTLQRGVKSDEVANLQARLIELGFLKNATADGAFGQMTEDAIKAAQEAYGMEATGIADNALQQKLYEGATPPPVEQKTYATLQVNSTGDSVVQLQLRLRELGYYEGKADGGFGAMTEAAVKKAQAAYGMEANGVADDAFQQALYSASQPQG